MPRKKAGAADRALTDRAADQLDPKTSGVPEMTPELAIVFAKLLNIGCPPLRAVMYCCPALAAEANAQDRIKVVARQWTHDALVIEAIDSINGGRFHELTMEQRMKLALDKSTSEVAFYLWANNYADVEHAEGIAKMKYAREVLKTALGQTPDEMDPMQAFARMAMDIVREQGVARAARKKEPPQLQPSGMSH